MCEHRVHLFVSRRSGEKMTENIRMTQVQWVLGILLCSGVSVFKMETIQLAKADFPKNSPWLIGENGAQKNQCLHFQYEIDCDSTDKNGSAIGKLRYAHVQESSSI